MPNQMKHTECRICRKNLEDITYDQMIAHINKHAAEKENAENEARSQTGLDDF